MTFWFITWIISVQTNYSKIVKEIKFGIFFVGETSKQLLQATVKIITNLECADFENYDLKSQFEEDKIKIWLPEGIPNTVVCTTGMDSDNDGVFSVRNIDFINMFLIFTIYKYF